MRNWLLRAPWWVIALTSGTFFGTGMAVTAWLRGEYRWPGVVVYGVAIGAAFGLVMGPLMARQNRRFREAAGDVPDDQLRRLQRVAWRRDVPDDPAERAAAHRVALQQEQQLRRQRWWARPFLALMVLLAVWLSVDESLWWLLAAVLFTVLLLLHVGTPRRLARRAEQLRPEPAAPPAGEHPGHPGGRDPGRADGGRGAR